MCSLMDYKIKKDKENTTKKDEVNTIHSKHIDERWFSSYGDTEYEDWKTIYKEDKEKVTTKQTWDYATEVSDDEIEGIIK